MTIKDAVYLCLLALVIAAGVWIYNQGEAHVRAQTYKLVIEQQNEVAKAVADQKAKNAEAVTSYESEIAKLHNDAVALGSQPVRLCPRPHAGPMPSAASIANGTKEGASTAGNGNGVSDGTGERPDIGHSLQVIAEVADRLAAQERATIEWAK